MSEIKAAIREQARKARVAQKEKLLHSDTILDKFFALPEYAAAGTVLFYVDAGSEVKTRHRLAEAIGHGKRVIVPWCVVETNTLELFHLEDVNELVEGAYKILEPKDDLRLLQHKRIDAKSVDLVMVPGTAFDRKGSRMGQGKGYYDRLLANVRPEVPLIALAFECQIFDTIPVDSHDVPMHRLLTEQNDYRTR